MSRRARESSSRTRSWRRHLGKLIVRFVAPIVVVLSALGYTYAAVILHVNPPVVAVEGSSMPPTLRAGDLVVLAPVHADVLRKGDAIALRVPVQDRVAYKLSAIVVQRIVRIEHTTTGLVFLTKGNQRSNGVMLTTSSREVIGRQIFVVPALGYVFRFFTSVEGVIFLVSAIIIWLLYYFFALIDERRRRLNVAWIDQPPDAANQALKTMPLEEPVETSWDPQKTFQDLLGLELAETAIPKTGVEAPRSKADSRPDVRERDGRVSERKWESPALARHVGAEKSEDKLKMRAQKKYKTKGKKWAK